MSQVSQSCSVAMMARKRQEGVKGEWSVTRARPKIYLLSLVPTTDFKNCASEEQGKVTGGGLFLLATVFYMQTNEGAGRKIMRDGVGERERERESVNKCS